MDYGGSKVMQEFWDTYAKLDTVSQYLIIGFFVALAIWAIAATRLDVTKYKLHQTECENRK